MTDGKTLEDVEEAPKTELSAYDVTFSGNFDSTEHTVVTFRVLAKDHNHAIFEATSVLDSYAFSGVTPDAFTDTTAYSVILGDNPLSIAGVTEVPAK